MLNSVLKWGALLAFIPIVAWAITYSEGSKNTAAEQTSLIQDLRVEIQDVRADLVLHGSHQEDRFEELEVGQRALITTIATAQDDYNYRIGILSGRLIQQDNTAPCVVQD